MKIIIDALCGILFKIGGTAKENYPMAGVEKKGARVVGIPVILGISLCFYLKSFIPLLCIGTYQILRLGYGIPGENDKGSFLGRIFKLGWLTRAAYGKICAAVGALPLFWLGLQKENYLAYILLNAIIGGTLDYLKAPAIIIETAQGLGFGAILWLMSNAPIVKVF